MSDWISVEDELPYIHQQVLYYDDNNAVMGKHIGICPYSEHNFSIGKVTHWMPLPDPPEVF